MMIAHAIRQCEAEFEIYDLLNAYLETAAAKQSVDVSREPAMLVNVESVARQIERLFIALESVSKTLDDHLRVAIKEALYVFTTALERLRWLKRPLALASDRRASGVAAE
jgi:hypothetical protein